jgi:hypothetical protein
MILPTCPRCVSDIGNEVRVAEILAPNLPRFVIRIMQKYRIAVRFEEVEG